jgi:hypothetical protein
VHQQYSLALHAEKRPISQQLVVQWDPMYKEKLAFQARQTPIGYFGVAELATRLTLLLQDCSCLLAEMILQWSVRELVHVSKVPRELRLK